MKKILCVLTMLAASAAAYAQPGQKPEYQPPRNRAQLAEVFKTCGRDTLCMAEKATLYADLRERQRMSYILEILRGIVQIETTLAGNDNELVTRGVRKQELVEEFAKLNRETEDIYLSQLWRTHSLPVVAPKK